MTHDKYIIELARSEHLDMLPEIELAAAALFPNDVITSEIRASIVPREQLIVAQMEDRLWVAVTSRGTPVGFAIALPEYNCAFLHEIDVHPAHQRRGLGRRLIQEVVNWAQAKKFALDQVRVASRCNSNLIQSSPTIPSTRRARTHARDGWRYAARDA